MTISEIQKLIGNSKLEQALKASLDLARANKDSDLENTLLVLSGRYNSNERDNRIGFLEPAAYARTRNQISFALLQTLSDLEAEGDGDADPQPIAPSEPTPTAPPPDDTPHTSDTAPSAEPLTTIVFLSANPSDTSKLNLDKELARISTKLSDSNNFSKFRLRPKKGVTPSEFREYLFLEKPDIVHFSGHGDKKSPDVLEAFTRAGRDSLIKTTQPEESGIFLSDEDKRGSQFVNSTFLKHAFKSLVNNHQVKLKAVMFNACHSSEQAKAVSQAAPEAWVIGTSWSVKDEAAIAFSTGFYFGIAQGMDVREAVDEGIGNALAYNEPIDRFLLYKNGESIPLS